MVTLIAGLLLVGQVDPEQVAEQAINTLPAGTMLDIKTESLSGCMMSTRTMYLRLDASQATVFDDKGPVASLKGETLSLFHDAKSLPYAGKQKWSRSQLTKPRPLVNFISHVCAEQLDFTSMAKGHSQWSKSVFTLIGTWKPHAYNEAMYQVSDEFLDEARGKDSWQWIGFHVDNAKNLKHFVYFEGYGPGGGYAGGNSFGWTATVRP